jgi:nitric-oxide synthase
LIADEKSLKQLRFSVLALGSSQYEHFAAFGCSVDSRLSQLGAQSIVSVKCADELKGQEEVYMTWADGARHSICEQIGVEESKDNGEQSVVNTIRLIACTDDIIDSTLTDTEVNGLLVQQHRKALVVCETKEICRLQPPGYPKQTVLAKLQNGSNQLNYLPGDHLAVFASNTSTVVQAFLSKLHVHSSTAQLIKHHQFEPIETIESRSTGLRPEVLSNLEHLRTLPTTLATSGLKFRLQRLSGSAGWSDLDRLPVASLNTWFTHFVDICAAPSTRLLSLLVPFVANEKEAQRMLQLVECKQAYAEWRTFDKPSIFDLFTHFPSLKIC